LQIFPTPRVFDAPTGDDPIRLSKRSMAKENLSP